ncbi:MAG: ribosome biogenesis GTP-binding protein YihA/YsxC [Bacteroidales bacterium]
MQIHHAQYLISSPRIQNCPAADRPEYAFIGRSNVGKSSLINRLANKKKLANTSGTPGKTVMINHFAINHEQMYWVDLPGYGYARRSKKMIRQLQAMIHTYLIQRENLLTTFVLVDSRREPQTSDLNFIRWCGSKNLPIAIVFTKVDKQKETQTINTIRNFEQALLADWQELPVIFQTSSNTGTGIENILAYMETTNTYF